MPPLVSNFDSQVTIEYPRSTAVGFSHTINPRNKIAADVIWYGWSSAFDSIGLKRENPTNPALANTIITDSTPLDWNDSQSLRLGYELTVNNSDILRLGYVHHHGASPDGTLTSLIPAVPEHALTVGYSRALSAFDLNGSYMYQTGNQNVRTSQLLGQDFADSRIDSDYHVFSIGVTVTR